MSVSNQSSSRRMRFSHALMLSVCAVYICPTSQAGDTEANQETIVSSRVLLIGTTEDVVREIKEGISEHQHIWGNSTNAEYDVPPPPCANKIQHVFMEFCTHRLHIPIQPCSLKEGGYNYLECATDYFPGLKSKLL